MNYCVHIISRQKAKELGMCRYFTGEPCNHGHVCERTVSKCTCVMCASLYNKGYHAEYYAGNKEKIKDRVKKWRGEHPQDCKRYEKNWYKENPNYLKNRYIAEADKVKERRKQRYKENKKQEKDAQVAYRNEHPEIFREINGRRRARKINAVPAWWDEEFDTFVFKEMAALSKIREEETGIPWHIDHMVPLNQGGLHWHGNWQLIPAVMNLEKKDKMVLTEPLEWLR